MTVEQCFFCMLFCCSAYLTSFGFCKRITKMNKFSVAVLAGVLFLTTNVWAANETPRENMQSGLAGGAVNPELAGASAFYVSDTNPAIGYASPLSIEVVGGSLKEGKKLGFYNQGSKAAVIDTKNTNLTSPLSLPANSTVMFTVTKGVWVSGGVKAGEAAGTPGTGVINVPPVSQ
jgi:hypothetical protein